MIVEIGSHKAVVVSISFLIFLLTQAVSLVLLESKPSKYAISLRSAGILVEAMPVIAWKFFYVQLHRGTLLYKGFSAMLPRYCFSKAREAPDITFPESRSVRCMQLNCFAARDENKPFFYLFLAWLNILDSDIGFSIIDNLFHIYLYIII